MTIDEKKQANNNFRYGKPKCEMKKNATKKNTRERQQDFEKQQNKTQDDKERQKQKQIESREKRQTYLHGVA